MNPAASYIMTGVEACWSAYIPSQSLIEQRPVAA